MDKITGLLSGKKTYGVAAILVLCVAAERFLGWDIPGFEIGDDWLWVIINALGLGTLRAAVTKSGPA